MGRPLSIANSPSSHRGESIVEASRSLVVTTLRSFRRDRASLAAAALAFYGVLSLGPLTMVVTRLASLLIGRQEAHDALVSRLAGAFGDSSADAVARLSTALQGNAGAAPGVVGLLLSGYAATRVFTCVQAALNQVWNVRLRPSEDWKEAVRGVVMRRLRSALLVASLGVLLLLSVVATTVVEAILVNLPDVLHGPTGWRLGAAALSFAMTTVAFAIIYKVIPDAKVAWRYTWSGAILSGLLFAIGKIGLSLYFSSFVTRSLNGTAEALVVVLLWAAYSSHVFLFGAEFTESWAARYGEGVEPYPYAEPVEP